jgi:hypothetical protein
VCGRKAVSCSTDMHYNRLVHIAKVGLRSAVRQHKDGKKYVGVGHRIAARIQAAGADYLGGGNEVRQASSPAMQPRRRR